MTDGGTAAEHVRSEHEGDEGARIEAVEEVEAEVDAVADRARAAVLVLQSIAERRRADVAQLDSTMQTSGASTRATRDAIARLEARRADRLSEQRDVEQVVQAVEQLAACLDDLRARGAFRPPPPDPRIAAALAILETENARVEHENMKLRSEMGAMKATIVEQADSIRELQGMVDALAGGGGPAPEVDAVLAPPIVEESVEGPAVAEAPPPSAAEARARQAEIAAAEEAWAAAAEPMIGSDVADVLAPPSLRPDPHEEDTARMRASPDGGAMDMEAAGVVLEPFGALEPPVDGEARPQVAPAPAGASAHWSGFDQMLDELPSTPPSPAAPPARPLQSEWTHGPSRTHASVPPEDSIEVIEAMDVDLTSPEPDHGLVVPIGITLKTLVRRTPRLPGLVSEEPLVACITRVLSEEGLPPLSIAAIAERAAFPADAVRRSVAELRARGYVELVEQQA